MTEREALKLALDAFGEIAWSNETQWQRDRAKEAITAIKEALAQPEQEPVAWMWRCKPYCDWPNWSVSLKRPADSGCYGHKQTEGYEDVPLYTTPPQRKPLTDEEMRAVCAETWSYDPYVIARAIEAAHGIKGEA